MAAGLTIDISRTDGTGRTETITNGQIIDNFITGSTSETPNILNQIMSRTAQGQIKTYVYDNDGNMTTGFTPEGYAITMTYDAQNRMTSAQYADVSSVTHRNEYSYAGNSLLAELKKYDAGALTGTTKYLRSGFLPMQERDAANSVSREYTWGLNLGGGIGGLLNLKQGGADYSYLYDGKGNVSALIDSSQAVVASYAYDPFGQLMSKSGSLDQPYTFSTKEYDAGTGQNYYGYRFRDSCSGRWATRDPLEEDGGINLYSFVGNNPVNLVDPLGLIEEAVPFPLPRYEMPTIPLKALAPLLTPVMPYIPYLIAGAVIFWSSDAEAPDIPPYYVPHRDDGDNTCYSKAHGKGERRRAGTAAGSGDPFKKKPFQGKDGKWYRGYDQQGKKIPMKPPRQ